MPKVSIIIPAYNAMTYLPTTLASVLQQTFTDFEVLIIDDGSTDHLHQWITEILDSRVKLIRQNNQGISAARNTGINNSKGKYIAFLDADDLWETTKLEEQIYLLDNNPTIGLVYTWIKLVDHHGKSSGRIIKSHIQGNMWQQIVEYNPIQTSTVIVRRDCLDNVGIFDQNLSSAEDWELWVRISFHYPFAVIKKPLVNYRLHQNNITKNWQITEQGLSLVIEKVFASLPSDIQNLKNRCYGRGNLYIAWKTLQTGDKNCQLSLDFRHKAIKHYPQLRYSPQFIRLSLAIMIRQLLGTDSYSKLLTLIYTLRRHLAQ
ncbi:glycosyltransferase family 2 protein [Cylindrospermum sp. FACHB-282]|uniref:glycosyltransferase family 2 protein n=1 Tax=Cylindrospermum sp. FACHB-282 TaxID=2692794 RepID=UPI001682741A|nr:glycosyltransferase [Cylindrospermum sp. FACHB-282]